MARTGTHILKSINISLRWLAWPVFLLCILFLIGSFTQFFRQYPTTHVFDIKLTAQTCITIAAVLLLCFFNWWLESAKWKILVNHITPCTFSAAAQSVLIGCSFGFITPNRIGDYAGRTIPFDTHHKPAIVALNVVNGITQFIAVALAGGIAFLFYTHTLSFFTAPVIIVCVCVLAALLALFVWLVFAPSQAAFVLHKTGIKHRWVQQAFAWPPIPFKKTLLVLTISTARAVLFIVQLVMVISVFAPHINYISVAAAGGVYFFVLTLSPSLVFNKLGLRESLSVLILAPVLDSPVLAATSVFLLWLVNQLLPVLSGSVLLVKRSVQNV